MPYSHMEVRPYSYFQWCGYFWGPLVLFVMTDEFLVRVTKITSRIDVSCLMALLSKACKPDNFELHNSLKPTFRNIWGLCLNFVDCESFRESKSLDILALSETKLDGSIDSGNFSVRGYLPLIRKDPRTHMHSLAVYVKKGLAFAWDLSLENSADSHLCFWLVLLHFT